MLYFLIKSKLDLMSCNLSCELMLLCTSRGVCLWPTATQAALYFLHRGPLVLCCSFMWLEQ